MIYDCFTFFNELDLLEIRLNILNDVVDKFVLVEMSKTHTGQDKPFYFDEAKSRFQKFLPKIIHIKVDDYPDLANSNSDKHGNKWLLENYQRDQILRGLTAAQDDDIIIVSDLDEIPSPQIIKQYDNSGIWVLEQSMMYYFLNMLCYTSPTWKNGTRMARFADLKNPQQVLPKKEFYEFSAPGLPTYFRFCQGRNIKNAGYHFSYLGGVEAIIKKRQSIVEQQFNTKENMSADYIEKMIASGHDILGRSKYRYIGIPLDNSFPQYILNNQDKYQKLICPITKGWRYKLFWHNTISCLKDFLFRREKKTSGQRNIYIFGLKVFSYKK